MQEQGICQQVCIEYQIRRHCITAAAILGGAAAAAAAACCMGHNIIRRILIYNRLLRFFPFPYIEVCFEGFEAIAADGQLIVSFVGKMVFLIVIENEGIPKEVIILDIGQLFCFPVGVCQGYAFDGACDAVGHILHVKVQVFTGFGHFCQLHARCFFIDNVDGNQYGFTCCGFYTHIVTTVAEEVGLSQFDCQLTVIAVFVCSYFCIKFQIVIQAFQSFAIACQLQGIDTFEPCLFFCGIVIEFDDYFAAYLINIIRGIILTQDCIGRIERACICGFIQIEGGCLGLFTDIAICIIICQVVIPDGYCAMRQHTLRQVLCACINSRRAICAVQGDGLCFAILCGNHNLIRLACQRQLCNRAICGYLGQCLCYVLTVNSYGCLTHIIAIGKDQRQPCAHIGGLHLCLCFIYDFICGYGAAAMRAATGGGTATAAAGGFLRIGFGCFIRFCGIVCFCFCFILRGIRRRIMLSHAMQKLCKFFSCYLLCGAKGLILIACRIALCNHCGDCRLCPAADAACVVIGCKCAFIAACYGKGSDQNGEQLLSGYGAIGVDGISIAIEDIQLDRLCHGAGIPCVFIRIGEVIQHTDIACACLHHARKDCRQLCAC